MSDLFDQARARRLGHDTSRPRAYDPTADPRSRYDEQAVVAHDADQPAYDDDVDDLGEDAVGDDGLGADGAGAYDPHAYDPHAGDLSPDDAFDDDDDDADDDADDADEAVPEDRALQRAERLRKKRRKARRRRAVVVLLVCLGLFGVAAFSVWTWVRPLVDGWNAPSDYAGPGTATTQIVIRPGDSGAAIGRTLEEAGVVLTAGAFVDATAAEPRSATLQPGTYEVQQELPAADALTQLLDPASKVSVTVVVRENLWVPEIYEAISAETGFSIEQLEQAAADPAVGLPPESGGNPEGYYYPATYSFDPDVTPVQVLATMVARHVEAMETAGVPPAARRDVLVRASIVQAEGTLPEDMAKIATVIQNRLDRGITLGMDSTVNYAVQRRGLDLTRTDLSVDSPYNTRVNAGLPPGPIGTPGQDAIDAVQNPEPGDWIYFVTVNPDTGETLFTADPAEFEQFVAEYRRWQAENG